MPGSVAWKLETMRSAAAATMVELPVRGDREGRAERAPHDISEENVPMRARPIGRGGRP